MSDEDKNTDINDRMVADFLSRMTSAILDPDDGIYIKLDRLQNKVDAMDESLGGVKTKINGVQEELVQHKLDINSLEKALENYEKSRRWTVTQVTLVIGIITVVLSALGFVLMLIFKYLERNTLW